MFRWNDFLGVKAHVDNINQCSVSVSEMDSLERILDAAYSFACNQEAIAIFAKAKSLIPDEDSWWRGDGIRGARHCLITAYSDAADGLDPLHHSRGLCIDTLRRSVGTGEIARWNDAPERTLADVHRAFDDGIALLKG